MVSSCYIIHEPNLSINTWGLVLASSGSSLSSFLRRGEKYYEKLLFSQSGVLFGELVGISALVFLSISPSCQRWLLFSPVMRYIFVVRGFMAYGFVGTTVVCIDLFSGLGVIVFILLVGR